MLFNSIEFIIFFPIVVIGLFVMPKKARCLWLLVTSYYFYMGWNPEYTMLIAVSAIITFCCGLLIGLSQKERWRKSILVASIAINLTLLGIFKYAGFVVRTLDTIAGYWGAKSKKGLICFVQWVSLFIHFRPLAIPLMSIEETSKQSGISLDMHCLYLFSHNL